MDAPAPRDWHSNAIELFRIAFVLSLAPPIRNYKTY